MMIHSTTILAVRHRDRAVLAGDGQVTFGQTVVKQSARKIRRLYNDRILAGFAGSAADSFALFSRFESKLEQYRGNLERVGRGAREGLAERSDPAPSRGDAGRARQERRRSCCRATAISSSPTMGIVAIGSGGPFALAAAKALAQQHRSRRARDRREVDGDRRRDLHLHQRAHRRGRTVSAHLSARNHADVRRRADAAANRRRARQVRRSARRPRSAPWRSRSATACGGRSCRRSWPKRSRRRTS